jgi:hypothetical protein
MNDEDTTPRRPDSSDDSYQSRDDQEISRGPDLAPELPFGMSGITGLLQRLASGAEEDRWSPDKQRMVARYLLDLSRDYWMNGDEVAFCRQLAAA